MGRGDELEIQFFHPSSTEQQCGFITLTSAPSDPLLRVLLSTKEIPKAQPVSVLNIQQIQITPAPCIASLVTSLRNTYGFLALLLPTLSASLQNP